jgi:transcription initiation factor TFIIIB Brf1 subunit/transcription initiation factor TFIIB
MKYKFEAQIEIIGINPYVLVPDDILLGIFTSSGKSKGHIPIKGEVNGKAYKQTLVKFKGAWRLYINTTMLENSPKRIGEIIHLSVEFDPTDRTIKPHPKLVEALNLNQHAKSVFESLSSSKKHEIARYISQLKTEESIDRNISRAIEFLQGKGKFVGRDKP